MYTGHVTVGGSICIEALTLSGTEGSWQSSFTGVLLCALPPPLFIDPHAATRSNLNFWVLSACAFLHCLHPLITLSELRKNSELKDHALPPLHFQHYFSFLKPRSIPWTHAVESILVTVLHNFIHTVGRCVTVVSHTDAGTPLWLSVRSMVGRCITVVSHTDNDLCGCLFAACCHWLWLR